MMTKVRFIHTADLHLDTPFRGLASWNKELAGRLKDATFQAFRKIIDIAIYENVDFLIISGDIFDSEHKSLAAQLKFVSQVNRLAELGIAAYIICGNHDPVSSWLDTIKLPENVYRFDSSRLHHYTFSREENPVADLYGMSFGSKVIRENLALKYKTLENQSPVSIAILHGTVGSPGPHENFAPFRMEDVMNKGFDYWALGHIHKRKVVHEAHPAIVYPGNPQGRDFGETGAKGCYLVEIIPGNNPSIKFIPTHTIRFEEIQINLTGEHEIGKLPDKIEEARIRIDDYDENDSYILRITLTGRTPLHGQLYKHDEMQQIMDFFNEGQLEQEVFTWIDQINTMTYPDMDIEQIRKGTNFSADVLKVFDAYRQDKKMLLQLFQELDADMINHLVKKETEEINEYTKAEMLEKAKWLLLDELLKRT